ncbi:hypothetical protein BDB00DRAFT_467183 [Zychaea mexicana]|uniref:uncharacterized protein n=1 Tax=Zychaea mexicana TaxID=64656 RepID=UPI0022FF2DE3|nr:uncharacterized protein BDB00DRAFT_467183 [Zychaea mexicana]KAI9491843.1 hypothetical protein BDB00DRAFT_467183 [Zychaea mexicana]
MVMANRMVVMATVLNRQMQPLLRSVIVLVVRQQQNNIMVCLTMARILTVMTPLLDTENNSKMVMVVGMAPINSSSSSSSNSNRNRNRRRQQEQEQFPVTNHRHLQLAIMSPVIREKMMILALATLRLQRANQHLHLHLQQDLVTPTMKIRLKQLHRNHHRKRIPRTNHMKQMNRRQMKPKDGVSFHYSQEVQRLPTQPRVKRKLSRPILAKKVHSIMTRRKSAGSTRMLPLKQQQHRCLLHPRQAQVQHHLFLLLLPATMHSHLLLMHHLPQPHRHLLNGHPL